MKAFRESVDTLKPELSSRPWGVALEHGVDIHPSWFSVPAGTLGLRAHAIRVSQDLLRFFPTPAANGFVRISRTQLLEFAKSEQVSDQEIAVLVFMWGCGNNDFNVGSFTEDLQLDVVERFVHECRELTRQSLLLNNELFDRLTSTAFKDFPYLHLSFGSKILYFCQIRTPLGHRCAIYDKKVSEKLDRIMVPVGNKSCKFSHLLFKRDTSDTVRDTTFEEYQKYCEALDKIGTKAKRRFDDVELTIFQYP